MRKLAFLSLLCGLALAPAASSAGQTRPELFGSGGAVTGGVEKLAAGRPPLYGGLGGLKMTISTRNQAAQDYFNQGWRLIWAFNHAEARRSFREAQRLDPNCAMCFWGEAFALGSNINDPMRAEAVAPAHDAIRKAQARVAGASGREKALIDALARRYSPDIGAERAAFDRQWAGAMAEVAETFPNDADVLALYADAMMNLQPWDYWEADGRTPKGNGARIVDALSRALALEPDHVGAAHLYIHALEGSATPEKAEAVADRLRGAAPAAGHLVHMPAHIYLRLGRYRDSMDVNRAAVAADEAFLAQAGDAASDIYRYGYFPHNVHFMMASAQMAGLKADALTAAGKLGAMTSEKASREMPWMQHIVAAPYAAHAQFSEAEVVLALPPPNDDLPFVKGIWRYARGVALASQGDEAGAMREAAAIRALAEKEEMTRLAALNLPARPVLDIARLVVEARVAQAKKDFDTAERLLREAVKLQDALPYTEPPYWHYPLRQTLGAVALQAGRERDAAQAFSEALRKTPRNGWALWGLWQAQKAAGDPKAAETRAAFEKAWLGDQTLLRLNRL